jgi:hypothetical protein
MVLAIMSLLNFHMNFRTTNFCKEVGLDFDKGYFDCLAQFGENCHLFNLLLLFFGGTGGSNPGLCT